MTSGELAERVASFLASYRAAFERLDAAAVADHFAFPAHVTSDGDEVGLTSVAGRQEWLATVERLVAMYRSIGVHSARALDVATTELSPRVVQATVRWALHDNAGRVLYEFRAAYTLAQVGGALRITAIAHNEIPQYRACVARLRSQRPAVGDGPRGAQGGAG